MVVASPLRRRSLAQRRLIFLALVALVSILGIVALLLLTGPPTEQQRAERFMAAWVRGDYTAMQSELTDASRKARPLADFRKAYTDAAATATSRACEAGPVGRPKDGIVEVPMTVTTRAFGVVRQPIRLPFTGDGDDARIDWSQHLTFPGVRQGERLDRRMRLAPRASILARDGTPLAQGSRSWLAAGRHRDGDRRQARRWRRPSGSTSCARSASPRTRRSA